MGRSSERASAPGGSIRAEEMAGARGSAGCSAAGSGKGGGRGARAAHAKAQQAAMCRMWWKSVTIFFNDIDSITE